MNSLSGFGGRPAAAGGGAGRSPSPHFKSIVKSFGSPSPSSRKQSPTTSVRSLSNRPISASSPAPYHRQSSTPPSEQPHSGLSRSGPTTKPPASQYQQHQDVPDEQSGKVDDNVALGSPTPSDKRKKERPQKKSSGFGRKFRYR